jgi:hypothetical protein
MKVSLSFLFVWLAIIGGGYADTQSAAPSTSIETSAGVVLSGSQLPVTPGAGPKTVQLLQFLSALQYRTNDKFITGQFVAPNYGRPEMSSPGVPLTTVQDCWNYHIGRLQTATGKSPALVGFDLSNRTYKQSGAGSPA